MEMETFPKNILENIFNRLDVESTLQSKRVCKTWRMIIGNKVGLLITFERPTPQPGDEIKLYYGDPRYETHIQKYYSETTLTPLNPRMLSIDPYLMVGSCNGLVCYKVPYPMVYSNNALIFTCSNPITGEGALIRGLKNPSSEPPVGGFGYTGSTNEYKVVGICYENSAAYVQVYTLGSHLGWRHKGTVPCIFSADESGIFANGALHWINVKGGIPGHGECKILAFGVACEEFCPIPSPPLSDYCNSKLVLLGGNLCVAHTNHQSVKKRLDIWAFKKTVTDSGESKEKPREYCYDDTWSWSKEYSIEWEGEVVLYTPLVITKSNTVLLWQNGTSNLSCYDPKTSTLQRYWDGDKHDNVYVHAIPHMNTLVSLEDLGEPLWKLWKTKTKVLLPKFTTNILGNLYGNPRPRSSCPSFLFKRFQPI